MEETHITTEKSRKQAKVRYCPIRIKDLEAACLLANQEPGREVKHLRGVHVSYEPEDKTLVVEAADPYTAIRIIRDMSGDYASPENPDDWAAMDITFDVRSLAEMIEETVEKIWIRKIDKEAKTASILRYIILSDDEMDICADTGEIKLIDEKFFDLDDIFWKEKGQGEIVCPTLDPEKLQRVIDAFTIAFGKTEDGHRIIIEPAVTKDPVGLVYSDGRASFEAKIMPIAKGEPKTIVQLRDERMQRRFEKLKELGQKSEREKLMAAVTRYLMMRGRAIAPANDNNSGADLLTFDENGTAILVEIDVDADTNPDTMPELSVDDKRLNALKEKAQAYVESHEGCREGRVEFIAVKKAEVTDDKGSKNPLIRIRVLQDATGMDLDD